MLQSTECFHQVHVDCFKRHVILQKAKLGEVKCPRCQAMVQDHEAFKYLTPGEKNMVEKAQKELMESLEADYALLLWEPLAYPLTKMYYFF